MKKKGIAQLKKEADKWCSLYVRRKDADFNGFVHCYTCDQIKHWKDMQCGHYVSRIYGNLRYYLPNLKVQCPACNVFKHGNYDEFSLRLEHETPGILEKLNKYKHLPATPLKWTDLMDIIEDFKSKLKSL